MSWGSNWGFSDASKARASAADFFLNTGNVGTPFGGTWCKGSSDCASGYACSGGRCVPITQEKGSDGTLSGCGAPGGGGGCDSYITQGMTAADAAARGYSWSNGVGTKGFNWEPIYSKDGCTITGCAMGPCGGGDNPVDCPGPRSCRYDAFGTVNCFCGDPPISDCSEFCTAYKKSNGEDADGCSGLACDECSYCDQVFISATGECKPIENGSPCHCDPDSLPECNKCNEDGTIESDEANCFKCVEIFNEPCSCNPNLQLSKTCCYPLSEWKQGLSPVARCKQDIQKECESLCNNNPPYIDPCEGDCESFTVCDTTCPTPPAPPAGSSQIITGQIEVPGECCVTYTNCDKTNVPESCSECDCNCHNDCPECQLCGADGKCYPDPTCDVCGEGEKVCEDLTTCCDNGQNCVSVWRNTFQVNPEGTTAVYDSVGGPAQYYIDPGNGEPPICNTNNETRDRLIITNSYYPRDSVCNQPNGVPTAEPFRDPQCFGPGTSRPDLTPYVPVLISSEIRFTSCCDPT